MESLHQDSSLSQDDRRSKMMDIRKTADAQIRGLLDSNQQKKWDEMQAQRGQWGQHRGQGAPDQQAPPQQQSRPGKRKPAVVSRNTPGRGRLFFFAIFLPRFSPAVPASE
jgi:hypothetical protein